MANQAKSAFGFMLESKPSIDLGPISMKSPIH